MEFLDLRGDHYHVTSIHSTWLVQSSKVLEFGYTLEKNYIFLLGLERSLKFSPSFII